MANAKDAFIERIKSLEKSINIESVIDKALTEREHNEVARMLRNGLAVVGFAALEDFIKKKCSEILEEIGRLGIAFSDLPTKLRYAVTFEVVSALNYQMNIRDKEDKVLYIQEHALKISSTADSNFELTPHAFGYEKANITNDSIKRILNCFGVKDPWGHMTRLSSRLGITSLSLSESYKNAATRRHKAAHVANANTPQNDISQYVKEAIAIAVTFDCLITKALSYLRARDADYLNGDKNVMESDIIFRIVKFDRGYWKEYTEGGSRAVKRDTDFIILENLAQGRASAHRETLIVYGQDGQPKTWYCNW